jgi:hypothetical protein
MAKSLFIRFNLFKFKIKNHQPDPIDLHRHVTVGSLSLNPTELSLIDNLVVINHFIILETYGEFSSI